MTNKQEEEFDITKAPKKITRVAVKNINKDDLYKEYLKLYKLLLVVQDTYKRMSNKNIVKQVESFLSIDDLKAENKQLKTDNEALYKQIEELTVSQYNARGAGRKSKFNKEQEQTIRLEREQGKSIRQLAKDYGCSVGLIHNIIKK